MNHKLYYSILWVGLRGVRTPRRGACFNSRLLVGVSLQFGGMQSTPSLPLLQDPLRAKVVVPARVPFMGLIDVYKLLVFKKNA